MTPSMNVKRDEILWAERYRPQTIADCILPTGLKEKFQGIVDQGNILNMTFSGSPGCGKTSVAQALASELKADFMKINCSLDSGIDTLRTKILQYVSTVSFQGGRKLVLLDEADYLNPTSTQPALRGFIESFSKNAGFIMTCNFRNKILNALPSRCPVIDFRFPKSERQALAVEFFKRLKAILKAENVKCEDDKILVELITKNFPDFRKCIGELQQYSTNKGRKIDAGILAQMGEVNISALMAAMKAKDFNKVRSWAVQNLDNDSTRVFRTLYDSLADYLVPKSIPEAILILAEYQYKAAFAADLEICMAACLITLMVELEFK